MTALCGSGALKTSWSVSTSVWGLTWSWIMLLSSALALTLGQHLSLFSTSARKIWLTDGLGFERFDNIYCFLMDSHIQILWPSHSCHISSVSDYHVALVGRLSPGYPTEMPFESSKWWRRTTAHSASRQHLRTFHRNTKLLSSTLALQRQVQTAGSCGELQIIYH